jgi:hypothetical protein
MLPPKTRNRLYTTTAGPPAAADRGCSAHVPIIEPFTVSIANAVELSDICRSEIYNLIGCGRVRAVKHGRKTLVVVASLRDYLNSLEPARISPAGHSRAKCKAVEASKVGSSETSLQSHQCGARERPTVAPSAEVGTREGVTGPGIRSTP